MVQLGLEIWAARILPVIVPVQGLRECHLGEDGCFLYHNSLQLLTACRGFHLAVLMHNRTLVVDCLNHTVSSIQSVLQQPRSAHFKELLLQFQRSHCDLCDVIYDEHPWPLQELQCPRGMRLRCKLPVQENLTLTGSHLWSTVEALDYAGAPPERAVDRVLGRGLRTDVEDEFLCDLLGKCPNLQCISLKRCFIRSPVISAPTPSHFHPLRSVDVSNCSQLTDAGVGQICSEMTKLRSLRLNYCGRIQHPQPFGGPHLMRLEAVGCAKLQDVAINELIGGMLEYLNLSECNALQLPSITFPCLTHLNISFCGKVTNGAVHNALSCCPKLSELRLNYSRAAARPFRQEAAALRKLYLRGTLVDGDAVEIAFRSGFLEVCDLRDCRRLLHLPSNVLDAVRLRRCSVLLTGSPAEASVSN